MASSGSPSPRLRRTVPYPITDGLDDAVLRYLALQKSSGARTPSPARSIVAAGSLAALLLVSLSCAPAGTRAFTHVGYAHPYDIIVADSMGFSLLRDGRGTTLLVWSQHCGSEACFVPPEADAADLVASCHPQVLPEQHRSRHVFPRHVGRVRVRKRRDAVWFLAERDSSRSSTWASIWAR